MHIQKANNIETTLVSFRRPRDSESLTTKKQYTYKKGPLGGFEFEFVHDVFSEGDYCADGA